MYGSRKPDVWVIGGTSGIGMATAALLMESGLSVEATGPDEVDVRNEDAMMDAYAEMSCPLYVVYSAGVNQLMWNAEQDLDIVKDLFDVNVYGFMRLMKVLATGALLMESGLNRSVVVVSSEAARRPMRTSMAYCASKAALDMCVRQAAREHAPTRDKVGIRVNAVAPGMTAPTGMSDYIDDEVPLIRGWDPDKAREYEASQNPMGDYRISPAEVALAIKYLLLDSPMAQTGSITEVNCGR